MVQLGLNPAVVNVLIEYVLGKCDNKLSKSYCEAVGGTLARKNVLTALEAYNILMNNEEDNEDTVKIGRIAVKKDKRGLHLGEKIVLELLRKSKEDGAKIVRVGAQTHAVGFYEKCGFSLVGTPEYMEENIPHYDMILNF